MAFDDTTLLADNSHRNLAVNDDDDDDDEGNEGFGFAFDGSDPGQVEDFFVRADAVNDDFGADQLGGTMITGQMWNLSQVEVLQQSRTLDYFDQNALKNWAGPEHWKLREVVRRHKSFYVQCICHSNPFFQPRQMLALTKPTNAEERRRNLSRSTS